MTVHFDPRDAGKTPEHFTTGLTGGGGPVSWVVRADPTAPDGAAVLKQESADDTSYRYPLCIYDDAIARNVAVTVKWKGISGTVDEAGGIVLRYRPENYYVARANVLENNVDLFETVNGKRSKIAEVPVRVAGGQWHTLRFEARGARLTVRFDGQTVIDQRDHRFSRAGKVGLWTKADSVSEFADLEIEPLGMAGRESETSAGAASEVSSVDLDGALSLAAKLERPLVILVADFGADKGSIFDAPPLVAPLRDVVPVRLDLRSSRNRATAARFHAQQTPLLICLSAHGVGVSRDDKDITEALVEKRIKQALEQGPALDEQFAALKEAARQNPESAAAQFRLTDFLMAHGNALEAIPRLAALAHSETVATADRIRAWVALGRAHLWIGESEKERNEARALLATLGKSAPEAKAAGELLLGIHEADAKRPAQARAAFEAAMAAAPESDYAKEAAQLEK